MWPVVRGKSESAPQNNALDKRAWTPIENLTTLGEKRQNVYQQLVRRMGCID